MMTLSEDILAILRDLLPPGRPIGLHEPRFGARDKALTLDCLDSGWVSSVGQYVDRFEQGLAEATGIPHAVATVNGTAALHTCLLLADVQRDDEVLLPALTFVGSANPITAMGAIPHFVDSAKDTLGVDPQALEQHLKANAELRDGVCYNRASGRPIRALVVVHVMGHVADMPALRRIADDYSLTLIEDAAEALGSLRDNKHAGHWGDVTALSFNGNKVITTGGGGALLTRDAGLARRAKHLTTTAKLPHAWAFDHDMVGYNYRLPNLNAALGCAQLEQLPQRLEQKRRLARKYAQAFAALNNVALHPEPEGCRSNYWLNLLLLPDETDREPLLSAAHAEGILMRPFWTPLHRLPMYQDKPRAALPVAESLFARGVCLPSSATLAGEAES